MDFNSLGNGSTLYFLDKEKLTLTIGILKEKTAPQAKYQPQAVPLAFNGTQTQATFTMTATMNGKDEVLTDIPVGVEIAQKGSVVFTGNRELMLQQVDGMMQASKKALEMEAYHKAVLSEGEKMLETLNPRYAEEKQQVRTIKALEERQEATDKKLASLESQNSEMLAILRQLSGTPSPKG